MLAVLVATIGQTQATSITVKELSVNPAKIVNITITGGNFGSGRSTYSGNAYAGVVNILADGTAMDAFCIDPFHFSSYSSLNYNVVDLQEAPKDGLIYDGPMGVIAADKISRLWAMAYSPTLSPLNAAALQLAIWEVVGGDYFKWNDPTPYVFDVYEEAQATWSRSRAWINVGRITWWRVCRTVEPPPRCSVSGCWDFRSFVASFPKTPSLMPRPLSNERLFCVPLRQLFQKTRMRLKADKVCTLRQRSFGTDQSRRVISQILGHLGFGPSVGRARIRRNKLRAFTRRQPANRPEQIQIRLRCRSDGWNACVHLCLHIFYRQNHSTHEPLPANPTPKKASEKS